MQRRRRHILLIIATVLLVAALIGLPACGEAKLAATTITLISSLNSSTYGQSVTFTATVSGTSGTPTGTVQFKIDGTNWESPVTLSAGSATSNAVSTLSVGIHNITAVYSGDASFANSTSTVLTQTVNKAATTITLISSLNPSTYGQLVIFTAIVSTGSGIPAGTVTFNDGTTTLGTATLSSSQATYATATLSVGTHSITAIYDGDASYAGTTSTVLTQMVNQVGSALTTTTVISSQNPSTYGQSVTFIATVNATSGTPTGTVQFKIDGANWESPVTLSAGSATSNAVSTLSVGIHNITAVYSGDASFANSTSTVLTQTVDTEKTLKIGLLTPATGVVTDRGRAGRDGLLDCVKYINEELGGVNGYKIEAVYRDSRYDAPEVVTSINEFMDLGCIMFMTHSSTEMAYAQSIANDAGFPGLVTCASPINYRPPAHIYGQAPDYGDDFATFASYYMQNIWNVTGTETGQPEVVVLGLNNAIGNGAYDAAMAVADDLGFELLPFEAHQATTVNETESLLRVKDEDPDLIFISSNPAPSAVIIKNLHDLDMYPKDGVTVAMSHTSFTEAFISLVGDATIVEGVYGVFGTATWNDSIPAVNKAEEYAQQYNPQDVGSADYLSTWTTMIIIREILKNALDNVGYDMLAKGDSEAWQAVEEEGIQKLDGYDVEGLQGAVSYTAGDNRLDKLLKVYQIQSGSITALTGWIEAPLIKYEEFYWWS